MQSDTETSMAIVRDRFNAMNLHDCRLLGVRAEGSAGSYTEDPIMERRSASDNDMWVLKLLATPSQWRQHA